jgi:hypothetical protein
MRGERLLYRFMADKILAFFCKRVIWRESALTRLDELLFDYDFMLVSLVVIKEISGLND